LSTLRPSQEDLLRFALDTGALLFGNFITKAGRETPYFFNSSKLSAGQGAWAAGQALAEAAVASGLKFDMLFGAAYKGIPLAALTAAALQQGHNLDLKFAYNRKEVKAHGEGGAVVGTARNTAPCESTLGTRASSFRSQSTTALRFRRCWPTPSGRRMTA